MYIYTSTHSPKYYLLADSWSACSLYQNVFSCGEQAGVSVPSARSGQFFITCKHILRLEVLCDDVRDMDSMMRVRLSPNKTKVRYLLLTTGICIRDTTNDSLVSVLLLYLQVYTIHHIRKYTDSVISMGVLKRNFGPWTTGTPLD